MIVPAVDLDDARTTQHLLEQAALDGYIERIVSIEEVKHWKPRAEVYRHAARVMGVPPVRMCLVAAHAWDILGANDAGLLTAWVARKEKKFHPAMGAPDVTGETLTDIFFRSEEHLRQWRERHPDTPGAAALLGEAFGLGATIFGTLLRDLLPEGALDVRPRQGAQEAR